MKYDIESIGKRKKITNLIKKFLNIMLIILAYNLVLLAISSIRNMQNISLFGYNAYIITTDSMQPSLNTDDVIISKKVIEEELKEGDVITFWDDQKVITHRIIKIEKNDDKNYYITKGDNNNLEDQEKKTYNEIQGKNILTIKGLGKIIKVLENKMIFWLILLVILILCFLKIQKEEKKDSRREKKRVEEERKNKN